MDVFVAAAQPATTKPAAARTTAFRTVFTCPLYAADGLYVTTFVIPQDQKLGWASIPE
jgi:hypothetical protein